MIASTKLARAQKSMDIGKTFADASTRFFAQAATKHGQLNEQDVPSPQLVVVCSSDRGLCGAIHSSLTKEVKKQFLRTGDDEDENLEAQLKIVALGDKVKTQLMRVCRQNLIINVGQISKNVPTFLEALTVVNLINEQLPLQTISNSFIVFNRFISAISYQSTTIPIFSKADILASDDQLDNLCEYMTACSIFGTLVEGHAAEMAARRSSMDNATKNAGEIINKLTMQYNRTRQAVITNELVDIITGAAAL